MTVEKFIADQENEIAETLAALHDVISSGDNSITASVGKMMGTEMIIYSEGSMFKYGLGKTKKHFSLHLLPMYCSAEVYDRYKKLLDKAAFQKGCINFINADELPLATVSKLIHDCSKVDMTAIKNKIEKSKKPKA